MIVIPMAGLSRRFVVAGYDRPKYMLPLGTKTVFDHAIGSFSAYFASAPFLFIARQEAGTEAFIRGACEALGIRNVQVQLLSAPTDGQAETVELGLRGAAVGDDTAITIFNIDTFRPGFRFPAAPWFEHSDGYLEVFRGSGANWSYVRPASEQLMTVAETAEKQPISDLCCTGLYHFSRAGQFRAAFVKEKQNRSALELYVAPLYNHLIAAGQRIHYELIDLSEIIFCGVPSEYEARLAAENSVVKDTIDV